MPTIKTAPKKGNIKQSNASPNQGNVKFWGINSDGYTQAYLNTLMAAKSNPVTMARLSKDLPQVTSPEDLEKLGKDNTVGPVHNWLEMNEVDTTPLPQHTVAYRAKIGDVRVNSKQFVEMHKQQFDRYLDETRNDSTKAYTEMMKKDFPRARKVDDKNTPNEILMKLNPGSVGSFESRGYATGGQLKAKNNAGMTPYLYNSLPQYSLGSWLAKSAGTIGSVAGGIIGSVIPGAGTALGASIGGGLGSLITNGHNQSEANDQKAEQVAMQQQQMSVQNAMNNYNAQKHPMYGTNFAMGGFMPNINTWQYSNVGGMNYACGGKMANGGYLMSGRPMATVENNNTSNDNGAAQMTKGLDNITVYPKSAGSHESNPNGGITVGKYGQTEGSEVRFGKYIFSNKF